MRTPTTDVGVLPRLLRVFCDADVLIAGAASTRGASHILLQLSELTLIECVTSSTAVEEAERNLLGKLPAAVPAFRLILEAAVRIEAEPTPGEVRRARSRTHPKDAPILAAAVLCRANFLATFNIRHFEPRSESPLVRRPGDIVASIRERLTALTEH